MPLPQNISAAREWVPIQRVGYTPAAARMSAVLSERAQEIYGFGQGNETQVPFEPLAQYLTGQTSQNPRYGTRSGGPEEYHIAAASYLSEMFNLKVEPKNAFLLAAQGRTMLKFALNASRVLHEEKMKMTGVQPHVVTQKIRWGLVDDLAKWSGLKMYSYDQDTLTPGEGLTLAAQELGPENIAAFLSFAAPDNPFSYVTPVEEQKKTRSLVDDFNTGNAKITFITDAPYAYICPLVKEQGKVFMKTGVDETFDAKSITPEFYLQTFSKFLGTASHGAGVMAVSDNIVDRVNKQLLNEGTGIAYHANVQNNLVTALGMKDALLDHAALLKSKYVFNGVALAKALNDNTHGIKIGEGIAGMMKILRVPGDILNREVTCFDGQVRQIKDGYDLMEYMANEHNVVLVYNETDSSGNVLIRLARAESDKGKATRGVAALSAGLDTLLSAPKIVDSRPAFIPGSH